MKSYTEITRQVLKELEDQKEENLEFNLEKMTDNDFEVFRILAQNHNLKKLIFKCQRTKKNFIKLTSFDSLFEYLAAHSAITKIDLSITQIDTENAQQKITYDKKLAEILSKNYSCLSINIECKDYSNHYETWKSYFLDGLYNSYLNRNKRLIEKLEAIKFSIDMQGELKMHPMDNTIYSDLRLSAADLEWFFGQLEQRKLSKKIRNVNFKKCDFVEGAHKVLVKGLSNCTSLECIVFEKADINTDFVSALVQAIIKQGLPLTQLTLKNNGHNDDVIKPVMELLAAGSVPLALLDLSENKLTQKAIVSLTQTLNNNQTLGLLDISYNPIGHESFKTLSNCLLKNSSLVKFIYHNNFEDEQVFKAYVAENKELIAQLNPKKKSSNRNTAIELDIEIKKNEVKQKKITKYPHNVTETTLKNDKKLSGLIDTFNDQNRNNKSKLIAVVIDGKLDAVQASLKLSSLNVTNTEGETLLHLAARYGHVTLVKFLIQQRINTHLRNNKGQSALEVAQEINQSNEIITILQNPQASLQVLPSQDKKGHQKRKGESTPDLVNAINVSKSAKKLKENSITTTVQSMSIDQSAYLISDQGSSQHVPMDVSQINTLSQVPTTNNIQDDFLEAIEDGHSYKFQRLLKKQPDLIKLGLNSSGDSALHVACYVGQINIVKLILDMEKADINIRNAKGLTAFQALQQVILSPDKLTRTVYTWLEIASLLIRKGATVNHRVADVTLQRKNIPLIQQAIAYGHYRLAKIILFAHDCDLNSLDDNQWTALDWAIFTGHMALIERLLIDPRITADTIKAAYAKMAEFHGAQSDLQQAISSLVGKYLKKPSLPAECGLLWTKNLAVTYGSRTPVRKPLEIEGEKEHAYLMSQNSFARHRFFNFEHSNSKDEVKDYEGNPVTASLTFVVSYHAYIANSHPERVAITVPLDFDENYHVTLMNDDSEETGLIAPEEIERIQHRIDSAPKAIFNELDEQVKANILDSEKLQERYQAELDSGEKRSLLKRLLHHGEQALLDYLERPQTIQKIINKLQQQVHFVSGCKVYGVILDIYSPRYACGNCEIGILGQQNAEKSRFMLQLSSALTRLNCVMPRFSPIRSLTRISSAIPYDTAETIGKKPQSIEAHEHQNIKIDLRVCNNQLILSKDIAAFDTQLTQFESNKAQLKP